MSIWGEDFDEGDELLAPAHYDEPVDEDDAGEDGDVSGADGIVRVWVEDGRLVKVRVCPHWYAKLERLGAGSLADVISAALLLAHVGVARPDVPGPSADVELAPELERSLPRLNKATLQRVLDYRDGLSPEFARDHATTSATPEPPVTGRAQGVQVSLDRYGQAVGVSFDEMWLDQAHAGQISDGVMRAAQDAYERFTAPPEGSDMEDDFEPPPIDEETEGAE